MNETINEENRLAAESPEAAVPGADYNVIDYSETEDAKVKKPKAKKKKAPMSGIRLALVIFCLCVVCFSSYKLIGILREYKKGTDTYSEVENVAFKPSSHTSSESEDDKSIVPDIDFTALKEISGNAAAWLYSPGTVINYPVAKTKDNSYYLDHLIDGTYNSNGCLFVDYRNTDGFADRNTIIYGHRMKNGKMLSSITSYNKQDYYDSHPVMYLITPDGKYELQIFSAYITEATSAAYKRKFDSDEKFAEWLDNAIKHSYVKTDVQVGPQDRVVTLSTCVRADDIRRFIAIGKMVKLEE